MSHPSQDRLLVSQTKIVRGELLELVARGRDQPLIVAGCAQLANLQAFF
jgi:hypothetical protein